jgi:hypothetical protein
MGGLVFVGMLALTGCVEGDRLPTLPPTPTSTPIFTSEEEALAAAEAAYAAYNEVSGLIAMDGGANPDRIAPFVTDEQLADELEGSDFYQRNGIHASGGGVINSTVLQQFSETDGLAEVVVYVCLDVSGARILDASGADVTPPDRDPVIALEVVMTGESSTSLLIADSQQWPTTDICS